MIERCEAEVLDLHRFFERWFRGEVDSEGLSRLGDVLSERFLMISPTGERIERRPLLAALRERHGSHRGPGHSYRIEIRNLEGRHRDGPVALLCYEEWQTIDEKPPQGRISTALLREREGTPHGVEWLHLQETWLPGGGA